MAKKNDFDVIIIGSGPAGSTLARVLAKEGKEVIILEKRKQIGMPVRCGEGLGAREVLRENLTIPREMYSTEIHGAKVVAPNGKSIVWKDEETKGWVLERKMFDQWLNELAIKEGARTVVCTRATDLIKENGKICGVKAAYREEDSYEIRAPLVISAEGMEAHIARKAGFDTVHKPYDVDTCYQYEMIPYDHENLIELYFGNEISPRGYCLTPDTEVIAKNTVKPITDIKIGEEVLTMSGWLPVSGTCERDYDDEVVSIVPSMLNNKTTLTLDHRVFIWNKKEGFIWKKAGELTRSIRGKRRNGDYLVFPLPKKEKEINEILITDYVKEKYIQEGEYLYPKGKNQFGVEFKYKKAHKLKNKIELSEELLEFFGYFVSEGNVSNGAVIISNTNREIVNRIIKIGKNIFGFEPYIFKQKCHNSESVCYQVQFASKILRELFKKLFGEGCENKRLPYFVHSLDEKKKLALLTGLYRGDGGKWKSSEGYDVVSYVSMSKSLVFDIWMLLAGIGIIGAMKRNRKKNAYEVRIRGKQINKLASIFGTLNAGNRGYRGFFVVDNFIMLNIRKLERYKYTGKVYDIESAGSFCPFFLVHNCWIFPKDNKKANVGLGIGGNVLNGTKLGGMKGSDPKILLDNFIKNNKELKDASIVNEFGGVISVGAPLDKFVTDNFMVIGTAAKQVDPIHGGGIALAMESGMMAAEVILKGFKKNDFSKGVLQEYEKVWKEGPGKKVAKRLLLRKVMEKLNDDDLNYIFEAIGEKELNQVMKGNFAGPVAKVLGGRPQLLKVLSALIS